MPQIRPITDLRNTNEISDLCHAKNEPIFITKNGYGDLVIMSVQAYESMLDERDIEREIVLSEIELLENGGIDARTALSSLKRKHPDKYQVIISPRAYQNIDDIFEYLFVIQEAMNLVDKLEEAIFLETMPQRFSKRQGGAYANRGYRQLFVKNFVVL